MRLRPAWLIATFRMRRREAVERLLGLPAFRTLRRHLDEPPPDFGRALQILLAERADDAEVQQRLGVRRIDLQRMLELL